MHIGNQIWKRLNKNLEWLSGRITISRIKQELEIILKPYGAKLRVAPLSFSSPKYWFMIGGEYTPGQYHMPITIDLFHSKKRNYIYFTQKRKNRFIFLLHQTLQHELVHKYQFQTNGDDRFYTHHFHYHHGKSYSSPKRLEYLAIVEEIDAYGHDLAMEIKYHYPTENVKHVLANIDDYKNLSTWKMYRRAFKRARWNQVRNELLRKTNSWLPHIKEKF
jgi:hypothetical protein